MWALNVLRNITNTYFGGFLAEFLHEGEHGWDDGRGSRRGWRSIPIRGVGSLYDNWVEGFAGEGKRVVEGKVEVVWPHQFFS